jgi:hypothetical protein
VHKKWTSYFGALPRSFTDALNEFSPSKIPIARAINTAPLVTVSGNVIDGAGLDRNSGLVHWIDPLIRACLPADPLGKQDVRDALNFLFDEWLVDAALDRIGKCMAIMLALTLIERAFLPERPAFFVTAGQRGGGKTTLFMRPWATLTFDPFCRGSPRRRSSYMSGMTSWSRPSWAVKSPRGYRELGSFYCRAKITFFWKVTLACRSFSTRFSVF